MAGEGAAAFRRVLITIIALALVVTGTSALIRNGQGDPDRGEVSALLRDADRLIGSTVKLTARVDELISSKSFTLKDETGEVLVLDVSTVPAIDNDLDGAVQGERVQVTGRLLVLTREELEGYVGGLDDGRYEEFVGEPVIVARSITPH